VIRSEMKDTFDHKSRNARTDIEQLEAEIKLMIVIVSSTVSQVKLVKGTICVVSLA